jgi:hypothetical protein
MVQRNVALIAETAKIKDDELRRVEKVLQKRMRRDVARIWNIGTTIQSYRDQKEIADAWPIIVRDDIQQPGAASYHSDKKGKPFAMVAYTQDWPFMASHDLLEMVIDPLANRFVSGPNPLPRKGKGEVNFLVEVCDPCADPANGYELDGFRMADFCTQEYYNSRSAKGPFSFNKAVSKPFQVLRNGYLTWRDPTSGHWWQKLRSAAGVQFLDLGIFDVNQSEETEPAAQRRRARVTTNPWQQMLKDRASSVTKARSIMEQLIVDFGAPSKISERPPNR